MIDEFVNSDPSQFLFKNKIAKIIMIIIFVLCAICSIAILIFAETSLSETEGKYYHQTILPFFLVPIAVIFLLFIKYIGSETSNIFEKQLETLRIERAQITQKIENEKEPDFFQTIQLSINQLSEYYTINKSQARSSFRFSIFSIVIGLLTILMGIWLYYLGHSNIKLGYITGISGLLLEFIGGAYFFIYKKSLEQVNFFYAQLLKVQDILLSINLADKITDPVKKIKMHEKIIVSLLARSLK